MEDELSEGEIVSEEEAQVEPQPATTKKPKLSQTGGSASSRVPPRAPSVQLTKREKRKLRKQNKRKMRQASNGKKTAAQSSRRLSTSSTSTSSLDSSSHKGRVAQQIIGQLAKLSQSQGITLATSPGASPFSLPLPKIKTISFQSIVLDLVNGVSSDISLGTDELCSVREKRVVVVWLSLVSAELFNCGEHFRRVKSLQPSVRFLIEHPGSDRYVKLGLEAFLLRQQDDEGKQREMSTSTNGSEFTRTNCLLSLEEMEQNGFPVSSSCAQQGTEVRNDRSEYLQLADWSKREAVLQGMDMASVPMFAVDCEMVETSNGLELARLSIVNESLECVYDTLVKPELPVLNYLTKFSGITKEMLAPVTTSVQDVHPELTKVLPSLCILVGHSLENDLRVLRLSHPYVIDTSCIFTPNSSPYSKPSLRLLAKKLLGVDIQFESSGHCSTEDAVTCMKLVQRKIKGGDDCVMHWNSRSILVDAGSHGRSSAIVDKQSVVRLFGRECGHQCVADSDDEVIREAKSLLPQIDLTFLQLHAAETFLKSAEREEGDKLALAIESLDANVISLVEDCPANSLVFVVCGSSDISEVKRLQQQPTVIFDQLKVAVATARTGMVIAFHVN